MCEGHPGAETYDLVIVSAAYPGRAPQRGANASREKSSGADVTRSGSGATASLEEVFGSAASAPVVAVAAPGSATASSAGPRRGMYRRESGSAGVARPVQVKVKDPFKKMAQDFEGAEK